MPRVLIESPYAGNVERNTAYAKQAVLDCLRRGEAPYASHLFFPQVLDDLQPEERSLGIEAGLLWGEAAQKTVVYTDYGISPGMQLGIDAAEKAVAAVKAFKDFNKDNDPPATSVKVPASYGGSNPY